MWSVTPEHTTSPYIGELVPAIESLDWTVSHLSLRELTRTTSRIVHIQWPEHVSRGPDKLRTTLKNVRAIVLLVVLRARRHKVIVTAHNLVPHGTVNAIDSRFRTAIMKSADAVVVLAPDHAEVLRAQGLVGSDAEIVLAELPMLTATPRSNSTRADPLAHLLMLGLIHPYHRVGEVVDTLIERGNTRPLVVAGSVGDDRLVDRLHRLSEDHPWLDVRPSFQSGAALDELVDGAAAAISLQQTPFNSGAGPFALPRHLPVALSQSSQAAMYAAAVGDEWVYQVPSDLESWSLEHFETWLAADRTTPDLSKFTLAEVAGTHVALYNSMLR